MKKCIKFSALVFISSFLLTSCYPYRSVVGRGPVESNKKTETHWNHYLLGGLIRVEASDSKKMAGESTDYEIYTRQSFVNGLISVVTFGIYTPTTTTVTK